MKYLPTVKIDAFPYAWRTGLKLLTIILIACITISRASSRLFTPLLWFEDGTMFLKEAYNLPFWQSIRIPILTSYYMFLNRLLAEFALLFNFEYLALIFVLCSLAVAVISYSLFLSDLFEWVIPSLLIRILFCLTLAILPGNNEIVLRFVNLHWYLGVFAFLLVLMELPKNRIGKLLYICAWPLLALSAIQSICLLPCLMIRAYINKSKMLWISCLGFFLGSLPIINLILNDKIGTAQRGSALELFNLVVNGFAARVLITSVLGIKRGTEFSKELGVIENYLWYIPYILFVGYIIYRAIQTRSYKTVLFWLYTSYAATATIFMSGMRKNPILEVSQLVSSFWIGERYFILALASFYFFLFWWLAQQDWTKLTKAGVWFILFGCILFASSADFYDPTRNDDYEWSTEVQKLNYAESLPYPTTVYIRTMPAAHWRTPLFVRPDGFESLKGLVFHQDLAPGAVDLVVSTTKKNSPINLTDRVVIAGWAVGPSLKAPPDRIIVFDDRSGTLLAETELLVPRSDIVAYFQNEALLYSGWQVSFPANTLALGVHTFQVYAVDDETSQAYPVSNLQKVKIIDDLTPQKATTPLEKALLLAPILPGQELRQEFKATQDNLLSVTIALTVTGTAPRGLLIFTLQEVLPSGEHTLIHSKTLDIIDIADIEEVPFSFPVQSYSKGRSYILTLATLNASQGSAVSAWTRSKPSKQAGPLTQGGAAIEGELSTRLDYYKLSK